MINYFYKLKLTLANFYFRTLNKLKNITKFEKEKTVYRQQQIDFDKKLVLSLSKSRIPNLKQLKYIKRFLKWQEIWLINISLLIIFSSLIFLGLKFFRDNLQIAPDYGAEYTEGLIGSPKYINPLYCSVSDVDNDISYLIFSSLFKRDEQGKLINDLAEGYEISEDNKIYTIKIKQGVKWHNNANLTVDDIIFTFNAIKDKQYQSPLRTSFTGVNIERVDDATIRFILSEPYAAFLDLLFFGIIPQELWQLIPPNAANLAELNLKPIGTGPFKFDGFTKDKSGIIRSYTILRNDNYYNKTPYIEKITFKFFPNFAEAINSLNEGYINGISYLPRQSKNSLVAQDSLNYYKLNLPQITAMFFNQSSKIGINEKKVRQALALAIDQNFIISQVLEGDARLINSPILPDNFAYFPDIKKYKYNPEEAAIILDQAGWKIVEITEDNLKKAEENLSSEDENTKIRAENILAAGEGSWRAKDGQFLIIRITTVDSEENAQIINAINKYWQAINIKIIEELIPASLIQNEIIKPRNYTALLYSLVLGSDPDPYPFWHSSQVGENGLNITDFKNKKVDAALEDARLTNDQGIRQEKYKEFQEIISEEVPAIFLYSQTYTYVQDKKIKGFDVKNILTPRDRFSNVDEWYIKTKKIIIWD